MEARVRGLGKFHILGGGDSKGSFSICYNDTFKMHKKPFQAILDTFIFSVFIFYPVLDMC